MSSPFLKPNMKDTGVKRLSRKFTIQYSLSGIIIFINIVLFIMLLTLIIIFQQKSTIMSEFMDSTLDLIVNTAPPEPNCTCICNPI